LIDNNTFVERTLCRGVTFSSSVPVCFDKEVFFSELAIGYCGGQKMTPHVNKWTLLAGAH